MPQLLEQSKSSFLEILSHLRFLLNYQEKKKLVFFIIIVLFSIFLEFLGISLVIPFVSLVFEKKISQDFIFFNYLNEVSDFSFLIIFFGGIYIIKNILLVYINYWQIRYSADVKIRLSNNIFKSYLKKNIIFFQKRHSSDLTKIIAQETNSVADAINNVATIFSEIFLIFFLITILILKSASSVILATLILIIISLIYYNLSKNKIRKLGEDRVIYSNKFTKILIESLKSIREIKLDDKENIVKKNFFKNLLLFTDTNIKYRFWSLIPRYLYETLAIIFICIIIYLFKITQNNDGFSQIVLFLFILLRLMPSFNKLISSFLSLRFTHYPLKLIASEINNFKNFDEKLSLTNSESFDFKNTIEFKDVNFNFGKNEILKDINVVIKKNTAVAIIGKSGSGKSTFLDLVSGLIAPDKGNILVDNFNIQSNLYFWRTKIGYLSQRFLLLNDTIINNFKKDNIEKDLSEEDLLKLNEYFELVKLKEFIHKLPKKYNTIVQEDGKNFSGGQRQRIGLAKILFKQPEILLLDEATNALDQETEISFFKNLKKLKSKITILAVLHKITLPEIFDEIYEIKDKKIKRI